MTFAVYGDGKLLATASPALGHAGAAARGRVAGVKLIELVARSAGAGDGALPVTWGNAALVDGR